MTTEIFIEKSINIHKDKYDYSSVIYISKRKKVKIFCKKCNEYFEQIPDSHLKGHGCDKCGGTKKLTTEEFIKKSIEIHNNMYDYSLVEYKNSHEYVKIICPEHGIFEQKPYSHLNGNGCKKCNCMNIDFFTKKSNKIHNNKYDYSYIKSCDNNKQKVDIICPEHGTFNQTISHHLSGNGCPKCAGRNILTTETFIIECKKIHGDNLNFDNTIYKNKTTKVKVLCPKHGEYDTLPSVLLNGCICKLCYYDKKKSNIDEFIKKSKVIHGDKYDYSISEYTNSISKINIICPEHGIFKQKANNHLCGDGCPVCNTSKGEKYISSFFNKYNIKYISQKTFDNCKYKMSLPFDFYLPDHNMCIEYDGEQHFYPINHFGGEQGLLIRQRNDKIKTDYCQNNNIKLIRIKHDEKLNEKLWDLLTNHLI